jgi:hypothetical protein
MIPNGLPLILDRQRPRRPEMSILKNHDLAISNTYDDLRRPMPMHMSPFWGKLSLTDCLQLLPNLLGCMARQHQTRMYDIRRLGMLIRNNDRNAEVRDAE